MAIVSGKERPATTQLNVHGKWKGMQQGKSTEGEQDGRGAGPGLNSHTKGLLYFDCATYVVRVLLMAEHPRAVNARYRPPSNLAGECGWAPTWKGPQGKAP